MQLQDVENFYPLSPLQEGILFHSLSDSSRMYFNQTLATLRGDLDVDAFRAAWQRVVDRHPILRTFFVWENVKAPVQVVRKTASMPLEVLDWTPLSASERESRTDALRREDLDRGFDLSQAPLLRAVLLRTSAESHDLLWSFHHILMDGWSMFQVLREVFAIYDAHCAGGEVTFATPPPYRNYIAWFKQQGLARAEVFWKRTLAGFTAPIPLPAEALLESLGSSGAAPDETTEEFATLPVSVSSETTAALQRLAKEQRLTLNTLLQSTWALLLARYSGEDDVVFGAVVSGRPVDLDGVESMVGLFINTLAIRVQVPPDEQIVPWLQRLQAQQAELRDYEYSPLVEVQGWSDVPRGAPLFETIYLFENYHKDQPIEEMCESLEIADIRWFERHNYPIAALVIPGPELMLRLIYKTERYSEATIRRLLEHWRSLLDQIVEAPLARLSDLTLVTDEERQKLLVDWNDTHTSYPRDRCVHELFEDEARKTPDATAVTFEGQTLSYAELNARANRLAHHLRRLCVGPEVPVALCVERSLEMVVGILGILKAGGAYVALDPDYPAERLEFMLQDIAAPVLLTQERLVASLPAHEAQVIRLDADWPSIATESDHDLAVMIDPENRAYVIYTSGSTGRPKGTCIPHRAVVRLVRGTNFLEVSRDDVFLQFATVSFDASTLELWGSLLNGARLAVFPAGTPSLEDLGRVIQAEGVTVLWLTAGLFHRMIEEHPEGLRGVGQLLAGGDVLSVQHVEKALRDIDGCTVINGYGPTENTTFTCCHRMTRGGRIGRSVPIGRPIANTTVYILDAALRPVPIGVTGDLYAGGDGLARGYLHHPRLTAERFVPNPFSKQPGARMYLTGDQARYRPDGAIEFLGRRDFQVKVRGFRIELGEIEAALCRHSAVRGAVVIAREDTPGDKRLVAYCVCDTESAPNAGELRTFLKDELPEYMLPAAFVPLDELPLTSNGKVDRRALPEPDRARPELGTTYTAPQAGYESQIAAIWQEVLDLENVGVHDNFFDLGGHSMHLIRVHARLKTALGLEIPMVDMFKFPTVSTLAHRFGPDGAPQAPDKESADASDRIRAGRNRMRDLQQRRRKREP